MSVKRVIIVEDSVTAAKKLVTQLSKHIDIEVIGVFDKPEAALPILKSGQVDGVLLDIVFETSDIDGLTLARNISLLTPTPWIIIISGFPEHAPEAINVISPNVLYGYLVKPYTENGLNDALNKVRHTPLAPPQANVVMQRIEVKHKKITEIDGHIDQAWITRGLDLADIRYVRQKDGIMKVHLTHGEVLSNVNIKLITWGQYLLSGQIDYFQQIHRQTIVNLKHANGIRPNPDKIEGHLALFNGCPDQLEIGGDFFAAYKKAMISGRRVDPESL